MNNMPLTSGPIDGIYLVNESFFVSDDGGIFTPPAVVWRKLQEAMKALRQALVALNDTAVYLEGRYPDDDPWQVKDVCLFVAVDGARREARAILEKSILERLI